MATVKKRGRPKQVANEQIAIEGVTPEAVVEPMVKANGSDNLGGVALKYYIRLEDGVGNSLGTTIVEFNGSLGEARAFLEGEAPTGLVLNNVQTGGVDFQLDGFAKPLKVVTIEEA